MSGQTPRWFGNAVAVGNIDYGGPLNYDDIVIGANQSDLPSGPTREDGLAYVFTSPFLSTEIQEDASLRTSAISRDGEFATSIACGKIDDDDKWDVVVGEPLVGGGDGAVHIFYGANINVLGQSETPDNYLDYEQMEELFGLSVAVGNMDSDSYADILVGAPGNDEQQTDAGRAYVYQANTDGSGITDAATPDQDLAWSADNAGAELGSSVAVGDYEGDGVGDAIVGARYDSAGGTARGSILIYDNPITSDGSADYTFSGTQNAEHMGWSLSVGQFSNDIVLIVATGAADWDDGDQSETDAGRVWVFYIPEPLEMILFLPMLLAIPIAIRRKRRSLQLRGL
jgi:hypothetical protein